MLGGLRKTLCLYLDCEIVNFGILVAKYIDVVVNRLGISITVLDVIVINKNKCGCGLGTVKMYDFLFWIGWHPS